MLTQSLSKAESARRAYRFGFSGVALFGLVLTACGSASTTSTPTTAASTTVAPPAALTSTATLNEWSIGVSATQIKAGKYAYTITNAGQAPHELLVFKSDLAVSAYPMKGTDIDEEGAGITKVSDGANIDPGGTQQRTIDLSQPGTYLFVCNIPSHYMQGMFKVVTVT